MTDAGSVAWEDDIVHGLTSLVPDDVPSLEIALIDAVADWLFSAANPGDGYEEQHAGQLVSLLFSALESARSFQPEQRPTATDAIVVARSRVVAGAHELADQGWTGVSLLVSRLMPAVLAELQNNVGERGRQTRGVFVYLLYAVAIGGGAEQDPAVLDGLAATFAAWDAVLRGGYVLPWRTPPA